MISRGRNTINLELMEGTHPVRQARAECGCLFEAGSPPEKLQSEATDKGLGIPWLEQGSGGYLSTASFSLLPSHACLVKLLHEEKLTSFLIEFVDQEG